MRNTKQHLSSLIFILAILACTDSNLQVGQGAKDGPLPNGIFDPLDPNSLNNPNGGTPLSPEELANNQLEAAKNPFGDSGFGTIGAGGIEGSIAGANCKNSVVTKNQINQWVDQDGDRSPSTIYVYIPVSLLDGKKAKQATIARVGFAKALYHTSFLPTITPFEDISDGNCAVYKVDLTKVWGNDWEVNSRVAFASSPLPDAPNNIDPANQPYARFSEEELADKNKRMYNAARIAFNLFYPTNYNYLVRVPENTNQIARFQPVKAVGGYRDGIPCGPRLLLVREAALPDGSNSIYFQAADPSTNEQGLNFQSRPPPLDRPTNYGSGLVSQPGRKITGSESIIPLPNGLLRYFVWRNPGSKGTKALQSGVIDPANVYNQHTLVNGMSCIGCHNNGIRGLNVDTANFGNGWSTNEVFQSYFTKAREGYQKGMKSIVDFVGDGTSSYKEQLVLGATREPVSYLIELMNRSRVGNQASNFIGFRCGNGKFRSQVSSWNASINEVDNSITE